MKLLHTSDWHIGRQFHNVSLLEDQVYVLDQIVAYIEKEYVDVVLIAGDIYDRSVPPAAAVEVLDQYLHKICFDLKTPVVMIPGNHDGAERLRFGARQLRQGGLHILGDLQDVTKPVRFNMDGIDVAFYGIPYTDPETVRSVFNVNVTSHDESHTYLVSEIEKNISCQDVNVLLSHCFIDGATESESERPLSIGGVDRVSYEPCQIFDYVALGHLHSPQFRGNENIRYSGSILKYSFSEQYQNKGVTLVDVDSSGVKKCTHLPLKPIRNMRIIEGELDDILQSPVSDSARHDFLLVRLTDKHAILDPMGKLREVYPNVLHLEKPGMFFEGSNTTQKTFAKRSELEMFHDFYKQIQGEPLSDDQDLAVKNIIQELSQSQE